MRTRHVWHTQRSGGSGSGRDKGNGGGTDSESSQLKRVADAGISVSSSGTKGAERCHQQRSMTSQRERPDHLRSVPRNGSGVTLRSSDQLPKLSMQDMTVMNANHDVLHAAQMPLSPATGLEHSWAQQRRVKAECVHKPA